MIYIGYTTWHDDKLFEFFDVQGIDKKFIPDAPDEPLIDVLQYLTAGIKGDILFLEPKHFLRLYQEKSKYNNFEELARKRRLRLVMYRHTDVVSDLADEYIDNRNFLDWLDDLKITIITDGRLGYEIDKILERCNIVELPPYFSGTTFQFHLSTIKKHDPSKDYFCLMHDKPKTDHRPTMFRYLKKKSLLEHGICNFNKKIDLTDFDDAYGEEYKKQIPNNGVRQTFPIMTYYNDTSLELVVESLGRRADIDTFYATEKTFKPMAMNHPFMILATRNHLKNIRDMGFRTFGEHWDESYDQQHDLDDRCRRIANNLVEHQGRFHDLYNDTKDIREHNLNHLANLYGQYSLTWWKTMTQWWKNFKGGNNG